MSSCARLRLWLVLLVVLLPGARAASGGVFINEFLAANDGLLRDEDQQSPDWIELWNSGPGPVNLAGWHLTDTPANLARWTFPATNLTSGQFLVVFASGKNRAVPGASLHTDFELNNDGGYLALVQPDGTTIAHAYSPLYPNQRMNVAYGLAATNLPPRYFTPPTPGTTNGLPYLGLVADTKFSMDRGFHQTPFTVAITSATVTASIYWTTNGSIPSPTNGTLYAAPVSINGTRLLRAAAFLTNFVPSIPDTHTYIFLNQVLQQSAVQPGYPTNWQANYPADYGMDPNVVNHPVYGPTLTNDLRAIPTISLVTHHDAFWHPTNGIYVDATKSGPAYEHPVSVELFNGDNTTEFQANCEIQMQGNASRDNVRLAKHSFRLQFSSAYGPSKLRYDWFGGGVQEFDNIVLRACFTDSWATRAVFPRYTPTNATYIRDIWAKETMAELGHLSGRGSHAHLYVNGLYWGLYNPTERLDAGFFATHVGGLETNWNIMRDFSEVMDGNGTGWTNLILSLTNNITSEIQYQQVAAQVEVTNLIDYMILHAFGEAEDWPSHNWYAAQRDSNAVTHLPATKWIFLPWDQEIMANPLLNIDRVNVNNNFTPALIYSKLRNWPEFRRLYGDRVQKHLFNDGALTANRNITRMQTIAARVRSAIVGESARWGDAREFTIGVNPGHGLTLTRDEWWEPELARLYTNWFPNVMPARAFTRWRAAGLFPSNSAPVFSQFGGAITNGFTLAITNPNVSGQIYFTTDGTDPRTYGSGAIAGSAQAYTAPLAFNGPTPVLARVFDDGLWSALTEAAFFPPQDLRGLALTEIMYRPPDFGGYAGDELEFLEFMNAGTNTLNLSGLAFTDGITFTFTNGTLVPPGDFVLLVRNPTAFLLKYPGAQIDGVYSGRLADGGEKLTLAQPTGAPLLSVTYDNQLPWPVTPGLANFSLVPINPGASQASDNGTSWRASTLPGGSPGYADPAPTAPAIVITEILAHTDPPQYDFIELQNTAATNVNLGGWFLSDDLAFPNKFRIPVPTILAPGARVAFTELDFNLVPGAFTGFALSSTGESVYLFAAQTNGTLTGYSQGVEFGASFNGVSFGRHVNSAGDATYPQVLTTTPAAANTAPRLSPVVISEIHYHPGLTGYEFIELANVTTNAVPLRHATFPTNIWKLNGVDFTFPTNATVPASGLLVVAATNPATFRAFYNVPTNITVLGPYAGSLQDSGENLELLAPDNPNSNAVPYIVMDAVRYNDKTPWPPGADGSGLSLQRVANNAYGNEPLNWSAAAPTPGTANNTGDSDNDGLPDDWEQLHGTQVFVPDASDDPDGDGLTNWQEFLAGTHPNDAASALLLNIAPAGTGTVQIHFPSVSNRTYSLLYKTNLAQANWLKQQDLAASPTNTLVIVTNGSPAQPQRYYRLVLPAQP